MDTPSAASDLYTREELTRLLGSVGESVSIDRSVRLYGGKAITLGSHVRIDSHCVLVGGQGLSIGDHTHLAWGCVLTATGAPIVLEGFNGLSSGVKVFSATDDYSEGHLTNPTVPDRFRKVATGTVRFGKHALVGANSVIMPGVHLGFGASVGALSFVNKAVPEGAVVSGNPLRLIGRRDLERLRALEAELDHA